MLRVHEGSDLRAVDVAVNRRHAYRFIYIASS